MSSDYGALGNREFPGFLAPVLTFTGRVRLYGTIGKQRVNLALELVRMAQAVVEAQPLVDAQLKLSLLNERAGLDARDYVVGTWALLGFDDPTSAQMATDIAAVMRGQDVNPHDWLVATLTGTTAAPFGRTLTTVEIIERRLKLEQEARDAQK